MAWSLTNAYSGAALIKARSAGVNVPQHIVVTTDLFRTGNLSRIAAATARPGCRITVSKDIVEATNCGVNPYPL
jgi:hypothetical protein